MNLITKKQRDLNIDPLIGVIATLKTQPYRIDDCIRTLKDVIMKLSLNTDDIELNQRYRNILRKKLYQRRRYK